MVLVPLPPSVVMHSTNFFASIALCPSNTPLAQQVQIPLYIDLDEDKELNTLMSSRITQMVVIDVLAVGVTMQLGEETMAHLKTIKRSLKSLRVPAKRIK